MSARACETRVVSIRGQLFEIVTDGDWGGGDHHQAMDEVEKKIRKLPLRKIIELHEKLEEEQGHNPYLQPSWADDPICDPIVAHIANPPEDATHFGATIHIRAVPHAELHRGPS